MSATVMFLEPQGATNTFSRFMNIPLLGPVYLATIAAHAGYEAVVVNENVLGRHVSDDELAWADQLCLTCLTPTVSAGIERAERYRRVRESRGLSARALIGGIHASMAPADVAPHFDTVAVGEGEEMLLDILQGATSEKVIHGRPVKDLDTVPIPDFSLVRNWRPNSISPVMTSRGCPHDCNFCSVTEMFGRGYRAQSPARVADEIMRLRKGHVFFVDDNFAANTRRCTQILELMRERGFSRPWSTQVRADLARRPELVRQMRRQGCEWVYVGLESINPDSLKEMQKGQTVEDIRNAIKIFRRCGICVHGMFMFGSDPDTPDVFRSTVDFARTCRLDTVQFNILTPLPGTRLYEKIEREGRLLHREWKYFDGLHAVFQPKHMSAYDLQSGMIACLKRFYTYRHACLYGIGIAMNTMKAMVRRLTDVSVRPPTVYGTIAKVAAKQVMRRWVQENRPYLARLASQARRTAVAASRYMPSGSRTMSPSANTRSDA
jgi:radical SAM superfamily enzyme YgiQ (UPF0313 family)